MKLDTRVHVSCEYSKLNEDNTRVGCECSNVTCEPMTLDARVSSWWRVANTRETWLTLVSHSQNYNAPAGTLISG